MISESSCSKGPMVVPLITLPHLSSTIGGSGKTEKTNIIYFPSYISYKVLWIIYHVFVMNFKKSSTIEEWKKKFFFFAASPLKGLGSSLCLLLRTNCCTSNIHQPGGYSWFFVYNCEANTGQVYSIQISKGLLCCYVLYGRQFGTHLWRSDWILSWLSGYFGNLHGTGKSLDHVFWCPDWW